MIDTIKIYSEISKPLYEYIQSCSVIKSAIDCNSNTVLYNITNDSLQGSYDSRLSVRVGIGSKYGFNSIDGGYYIEIEGSYHKFSLGYNSHNGFYDLQYIVVRLIETVEFCYSINLPDNDKWFLQRVDIAICYDLRTQENVKSYINSLSKCNYPRRKIKFFNDESIYLSGTTTTLKIYNKLLEFRKHDLNRFKKTDFDLINYIDEIKGFLRYECEIKKKKLEQIYNKNKICFCDVFYDDLKKVWCDEFMKFLKFIDSDLKSVRSREDVFYRLNNLYNKNLAYKLYSFYLSIKIDGVEEVRDKISKPTFYRYLNYLKSARIDFSQSYNVENLEYYFFNPFTAEEVAWNKLFFDFCVLFLLYSRKKP